MAEHDHKAKGCPGEERLSELILLGESAPSELAAHVDSCPDCSASLETMREIDTILRENGTDLCPDAPTMAAFLDGSLEAHESAPIESHVASCPICFAEREVHAASGTGGPEIVEIPDEALRAVKDFARPAPVEAAPAPAPVVPVRAMPVASPTPARNGFAFRTALGVGAAAAGFVLALTLFLLLGGKDKGVDEPEPTDAMTVFAPSKENITKDRPPTESPVPHQGESVEAPDPKPAPSSEEPLSPPSKEGPAPSEVEPEPRETVENPAPPEETPGEKPRNETVPGEVPAEVEKPEEPSVPKSRPNRSWTVDVAGEVKVKPGSSSSWRDLEGGKPVFGGSELMTAPHGPARISFGESGEVLLRESTTVSIAQSDEGIVLNLRSGEALASNPRGAALTVKALDAEVTARRASSFGVTTSGKGLLYVLEGSVTATIGGVETVLNEGLSLALKNGNGRRTAKHFDPRIRAAWASVFGPLTVEVFHEGFESSPRGWKGKLERKDTFRNSKGALRARGVKDPSLAVAVMKVNHKPLFGYRPNIRVEFACKLEGTDTLELRLWSPDEGKFHSIGNIRTRGEGWRKVRVHLGRSFGRRGPEIGTVITGIVIGSRTRDARLIVDDVTILRVPGPAPSRLKGFEPSDLEAHCRCPGKDTCESCRVARVLELLRELEVREKAAKPGPGNDPRAGGGKDEEPGKSEEPKDGGGGNPPGATPPNPPPGGPPGPPPGGPPGPPPGGPVMPPPPGGPVPPSPGQPRPSGQPGTPGQTGGPKDGKDEEPEEPATKEDPGKEGKEAPAAGTPENIRRLKRWLREQLPATWPPYPGWKATCVEGRNCDCSKKVKKYFARYRLKEDE